MTTRRIDCECVWDWNTVPPNNRDKGRLKDKHQASLVNLNGWGNANLSVIRSKIQKELLLTGIFLLSVRWLGALCTSSLVP